MNTFDQKTVMKKYDEVSCLENLVERREFFLNQSAEMKVALWLENIDRKTKDLKLSAEQKEILDFIKEKFVTVEYAESVKGKSEDEAPQEYREIMNKAVQLIGKDNLKELVFILGDSSTLNKNSFCNLK